MHPHTPSRAQHRQPSPDAKLKSWVTSQYNWYFKKSPAFIAHSIPASLLRSIISFIPFINAQLVTMMLVHYGIISLAIPENGETTIKEPQVNIRRFLNSLPHNIVDSQEDELIKEVKKLLNLDAGTTAKVSSYTEKRNAIQGILGYEIELELNGEVNTTRRIYLPIDSLNENNPAIIHDQEKAKNIFPPLWRFNQNEDPGSKKVLLMAVILGVILSLSKTLSFAIFRIQLLPLFASMMMIYYSVLLTLSFKQFHDLPIYNTIDKKWLKHLLTHSLALTLIHTLQMMIAINVISPVSLIASTIWYANYINYVALYPLFGQALSFSTTQLYKRLVSYLGDSKIGQHLLPFINELPETNEDTETNSTEQSQSREPASVFSSLKHLTSYLYNFLPKNSHSYEGPPAAAPVQGINHDAEADGAGVNRHRHQKNT